MTTIGKTFAALMVGCAGIGALYGGDWGCLAGVFVALALIAAVLIFLGDD